MAFRGGKVCYGRDVSRLPAYAENAVLATRSPSMVEMEKAEESCTTDTLLLSHVVHNRVGTGLGSNCPGPVLSK